MEVQNVFIELTLVGSAFNYKHYMNEEGKKEKETRRLKSRQEERIGLEGSEESVCSEEEERPPMGNGSSGCGGGRVAAALLTLCEKVAKWMDSF